MDGRRPIGVASVEPTRITPYELVFGEGAFEDRLFPAIAAEAERNGIDAGRLDMFTLLSTATDALHEMVPTDAPVEAMEQHRVILFQVFNFWRSGRRFFVVEPAVARYLVEASPAVRENELPIPHAAFYVQLPANLFWASIAPDTPPEPVDGFFATCFDGRDTLDDPFRHLYGLMVLGIRRDRAGFSVIPFETEAGPGIPGGWADPRGRDSGRDFDSVLPGGEMAGMYSILTTAEALKLLTRVLHFVDTSPDGLVHEEPGERLPEDRPGAVRPSRLPVVRVRLGGDPRTGAVG